MQCCAKRCKTSSSNQRRRSSIQLADTPVLRMLQAVEYDVFALRSLRGLTGEPAAKGITVASHLESYLNLRSRARLCAATAVLHDRPGSQRRGITFATQIRANVSC